MAISSRDRWVTVRDSETKKQDIRSTGTTPSEAIRAEQEGGREDDGGEKTTRDRKRNGDSTGVGGWSG